MMTALAPSKDEYVTVERTSLANVESAIKAVVDPRLERVNYLASLAYDAICSGKFGEGPFEITLTAEGNSFAIVVDGGKH